MNRRGLLLGLGAALAAPAVVRAESLMRLTVASRQLLLPETVPLVFDGYAWNRVVTLDEFSARILAPAISALTEQIANDILSAKADFDFTKGLNW